MSEQMFHPHDHDPMDDDRAFLKPDPLTYIRDTLVRATRLPRTSTGHEVTTSFCLSIWCPTQHTTLPCKEQPESGQCYGADLRRFMQELDLSSTDEMRQLVELFREYRISINLAAHSLTATYPNGDQVFYDVKAERGVICAHTRLQEPHGLSYDVREIGPLSEDIHDKIIWETTGLLASVAALLPDHRAPEQ